MSGLEQRTEELSEAPAGAYDVGAVAARSSNTEAAGAPRLSCLSGWPEIEADLIDDRRVCLPAFPLELLPSPWRDWVSDAARSADAPVDYVAQAVLAAIAGVGGSRVVLSIAPGWLEPLLLRLAVVGAASTGKTPALLSVRRLLVTLERQACNGDEPKRQIVLREARFDQMAATLVRNPRGMVLWRDGAAGCLAPLGGGRGIRDLDPYTVSVLGSIEPDCVAQGLPRGGDGLAARFLYAWPSPPPQQREGAGKTRNRAAALSQPGRLEPFGLPDLAIQPRQESVEGRRTRSIHDQEVRLAGCVDRLQQPPQQGQYCLAAQQLALGERPWRCGPTTIGRTPVPFCSGPCRPTWNARPAGSCAGCAPRAAPACREKTCAAPRSARWSTPARPIASWRVSSRVACCAG